jgi:homocitrate synthase NifV
MKIVVGQGSCGIATGAKKVANRFEEILGEKNIDINVDITGCIGTCFLEPIVDIYEDGKDEPTRYVKVKPDDVAEIVESHIEGGKVVENKEISEENKKLMKKQKRIVLRNCGSINPEEIDEYIARDGYKATEKVLTTMTDEEVIDVIKVSGLRGRGGAGFPTWFKWNAARQNKADQKYIVCNADEGDPGAFMDRAVLEGDPHSLLEGMIIGGYAMGATEGVIYVRAEYPLAIKRLKIAIAQALSDIGIDQLEVGIPTMGGDEKATIKAICKRNLKASIMAWNRAVVSDIEQSIDCGVDAVAISLSVSDIHIQHKLKKSREWVLENMFNAVSFANKNGLYISVNGEDASRADTDFLIEFINVAKQAGANRFRFCDTVGVMEPFATREKIEKIHKATNFDIEMHTHNDFGMATANAIAGVIGGANYIGCTVNGLGERAGNAALEEVLMALKFVYGYDTDVDTTKFVEICKYVSQASGRRLPPWKAIVGTNMFRHESGIHADGALKDPKNYEAFDPAEVGLQRQIVIGKHSGKAAIVNKFKEYSIELTNEEANQILEEVRKVSVGLKRELFDKELVQIYHDIKNDYKIF